MRPRSAQVPLPCRPQADHVRDPSAPDLGVSPKRKWMYHYTQRIFASGTHYVFLGSDDDVFPVDALGPVGSVCAHGGSAASPGRRRAVRNVTAQQRPAHRTAFTEFRTALRTYSFIGTAPGPGQ